MRPPADPAEVRGDRARVGFDFGEGAIAVEVPEPIGAGLACLYPDHRAPLPDAPPALRVDEVSGGWQLFDGDAPVARARDALPDVLAQVEYLLAEYLASVGYPPGFEDRGVHAGGSPVGSGGASKGAGARILHAGGASVAGRAILLSGHGGSGKSTLTAALALSGRPVFGDDLARVDAETGLVSPIRRLIKVMEAPRAALGLPRPGTALDELWPEAAFYHPADLGSRWADPAPVGLLAFPSWSGDPEGAPQLTPLAGGETLHRLLFQLLLIDRHGVDEVELLGTLLDHATTFEISWGAGKPAAEALVRALAGPRDGPD